MRIAVKYEGTVLMNDPDYDEWDNNGVHLVLRCQHDNLVIEPPCCSGADCDCGGRHSLRCPDCEDNLTEREIEERMESYFDRGDFR